jgi:hypothetical protein
MTLIEVPAASDDQRRHDGDDADILLVHACPLPPVPTALSVMLPGDAAY